MLHGLELAWYLRSPAELGGVDLLSNLCEGLGLLFKMQVHAEHRLTILVVGCKVDVGSCESCRQSGSQLGVEANRHAVCCGKRARDAIPRESSKAEGKGEVLCLAVVACEVAVNETATSLQLHVVSATGHRLVKAASAG